MFINIFDINVVSNFYTAKLDSTRLIVRNQLYKRGLSVVKIIKENPSETCRQNL